MTELYHQMMARKDDEQVANLSRFFKTGKGQYGEGDKFLGIKVPITRQVVKEYWQTAALDQLNELITCEYHEIRLCALLTLVQIFKHAKKQPELQQKCIEFYLSHTAYINNWDLVDLSCYELLGNWLLNKDRSILYDLARNGKTIWEQRIGIVTCLAFVRRDQFDDALALADILLHHKHDLLHKATGWVLREVGKHDETRLRAYLESPASDDEKARYLVMPRTMLRYAIEKFPESVRQAYLHGQV